VRMARITKTGKEWRPSMALSRTSDFARPPAALCGVSPIREIREIRGRFFGRSRVGVLLGSGRCSSAFRLRGREHRPADHADGRRTRQAHAARFQFARSFARAGGPRRRDVAAPEVIDAAGRGWDVSSQRVLVSRAWEVWRRDVSNPEVIVGLDGGWDVSSQRVLVSKAWECGDETSPPPK